MTRTCNVLGVELNGALRVCDLNVATIMVAIRIFEISIFQSVKRK